MAPGSVGIIGYGVVGKRSEEQLGVTALTWDLHGTQSNAAWSCEIVLLCLPTPSGGPLGLDLSVLELALESCGPGEVVIRSTLPVGGLAYLEHCSGRMLHYWPELGSENGNYQPPYQLLSTDTPLLLEWFLVARGYEVRRSSGEVLEWLKMATNALLATQVALANELSSQGASWNAVLDLLELDPRINTSHLNLNGSGGYGGKCLPKDVGALAQGPLLSAVLEYAVWHPVKTL